MQGIPHPLWMDPKVPLLQRAVVLYLTMCSCPMLSHSYLVVCPYPLSWYLIFYLTCPIWCLKSFLITFSSCGIWSYIYPNFMFYVLSCTMWLCIQGDSLIDDSAIEYITRSHTSYFWPKISLVACITCHTIEQPATYAHIHGEHMVFCEVGASP